MIQVGIYPPVSSVYISRDTSNVSVDKLCLSSDMKTAEYSAVFFEIISVKKVLNLLYFTVFCAIIHNKKFSNIL